MSRNVTFTPVDPERIVRSGSYVIDDDRIQERLDRESGRTEVLWIHPTTLVIAGSIVTRPRHRTVCWYDVDGNLVHRVQLGGES